MAQAPGHLLDLTRPISRDDLVINGRKAEARITEGLTSATAERTMDGTSTITLEIADQDWSLLRTDAIFGEERLAKGVTLELDGLSFTLSEIEKTDDGEQLVFYDSVVAALQAHDGARKASRGKMTRAEFAHLLCREAGVPFVSPDEHDKQPISDLSEDDAKQLRDAQRNQRQQASARDDYASGSLRPYKLKIQGGVASAGQKRNLEIALAKADELGVSAKARLAMVLAGIAEGGWKTNNPNGSSGANGPFQILPSTAHNLGVETSDIAAGAEIFLVGSPKHGHQGFTGSTENVAQRLARHKDLTAGGVANLVEGGGAGAGFYDKFRSEADKILRSWDPAGRGRFGQRTGTPDRARVKTYEFRRQRGENSWDALDRLAQEVGWRRFAVAGRVYFVSDFTLIGAKPSLEISEKSPGIDKIRWTWSRGRRIDELTVDARTRRWAAAPGTVVVVDDEGPANGRWLVRTISRDLLDPTGAATITLGQPVAPKAEPASTVETKQGEEASGQTRSERAAPVGKYPLAVDGKFIQGPGGSGTHSRSAPPNNWESDNAVDIGCPKGTAVYAVDDGTIGSEIGLLPGGNNNGVGAMAGNRLHLVTNDNEWYYAHLSRIAGPEVRAGAKVKAGQLLGWSGVANGVEHLHIACKYGNPKSLLGVKDK